MQWEHLAMELQNKVRWAISTSYAENGGLALPFREAVNLAKEVSGQLIIALKRREEMMGILDVRNAAKELPGQFSSGSGSSPGSNDKRAWALGRGENPGS